MILEQYKWHIQFLMEIDDQRVLLLVQNANASIAYALPQDSNNSLPFSVVQTENWTNCIGQ